MIVALIYIAANSFFHEPQRRNFNAIMIAGAGAAYLNGGFGRWEFGFTAVVTYFAYQGLRSYRFIGIGWLLHTAWDVLHHLYGNPIVPFAPTSSLGCAICDPIIAAWCFVGAPDPFAALADRIRHTPIKIFHGANDERISVHQSRRLVAALKSVGADVQYTEYPDTGHDADKAYAEIVDWVVAQQHDARK